MHDDIEVIRRWHKEAGFDDIGYHFFVPKLGLKLIGRPLEYIGAHCLGHNKDSIGICLSGKNEFSEEQFMLTAALIEVLAERFDLKDIKNKIFPHNYLNKVKTCPNFDINKITDMIDYP